MARNNRHEVLPENVKRKDDTSKNAAGLQEKIIAQQEREKKLYPLRIRKDLMLLVPAEKCNEEYAEIFRRDKMRGAIL